MRLFLASLLVFFLGVNSKNVPSEIKQVSNPLEMPDTLEMTLELDDQQVNLNLVKNPNIPSDFPVFVGTKYTTRKWSPGDHGQLFAAYVDRDLGASITIQIMKENGMIKKSIRGFIPLGNDMYSLSPVGSTTPSAKKGSSRRVNIDGEAYHMDLEERDMDFKCSVKSDKKSSSTHGHYTHRQSTAYTVDLLIVTDYAIYQKWYDLSTESSPSDNDIDAERNITFYFVHVANGMDQRYKSISQSDFSVGIRLVGLFIAKDPSQAPFTEGEGIRLEFEGEVYANMYKGLSAFQDWEAKFAEEYTKFFDQATLFAGNTLYDGDYLHGKPSVKSGLANIGSYCNIGNPMSSGLQDSVSICQDNSMYASANTGAHEMAHNFGSLHDGEEGNTCNSDDQYIMAVAPGGVTEETEDNPYKFSSCSIKYMKDFLAKLSAKDPNNCLVTQSDKPTLTARSKAIRQELQPGEKFNIDQQCQHVMFSSGSYYCAGQSRDERICYSLVCWNPKRNQCESSNAMRGYDYTTCGNGKWCQLGKCVADPAAPTTPTDTCIYGERKDTVHFAENVKLACKELPGAESWRCYDHRTAGECCETCPAIRDDSKPGCEYGDRDPSYCAANQVQKNCYDASFSQTCCDFCNSAPTGEVEGCDFGDQAEWCKTVTPVQCYNDHDTCCDTCSSLVVSDIEGCEYGDMDSFCTEHPIDQVCGAYPEVCCITCKDFGSKKHNKYENAVKLLKSLISKYEN